MLRSPGRSPFAALAAINILAHDEAAISAETRQTPLSDQMGVLSAALSGSAIDAGLLKVFLYLGNAGQPDHEQATLLLEVCVLAPGSEVRTDPAVDHAARGPSDSPNDTARVTQAARSYRRISDD